MSTATTTATQPRRAASTWHQPFVYVIAATAILVSIIPVLYVWISGFRSSADLNSDPAGWPDPWFLGNYANVLSSSRFWGSVFSSSLVAVGTTLGVVVLGIAAAYVIARYQFAGRQGLYAFFSAGLMFPVTVAALPLSILLRDLDLNGTFVGLIIPQVAFALPVTIIILVPFLRAIPKELEEAASIDGTSRLGFFWFIMLPLSGPGLVTVGVLAFLGSWNGYLLPLLVMAAGGMPQDLWTLPLGVQQFSTQYSQDTGAVLAYTSLAMIPALAFFLIAEKRIVSGLAGAVKG
ncbi:carbohydrate ABC transporter membrane protein 2 (CUT1 family) [Homoserinimonas aerilata]|uniref:Carbohydrate ABC transporter membrane protein 2 (CUT1 family) n=1 Tax=Homoserinimonas aerilata TaxID=1162970 RepID=A0A542YL30_9MICO|nr:carbohydrate ABC transporter permease [Homoserinimonas aerilata]TQL48795.1 carbohydrate ABC transporter membrane protein 2 (CUT1 family) [Homoserinimonas aerilata]